MPRITGKFRNWESPGNEERFGVPRRGRRGCLIRGRLRGGNLQDSTDDGNEGEVLGFEPRQEFELEQEGISN